MRSGTDSDKRHSKQCLLSLKAAIQSLQKSRIRQAAFGQKQSLPAADTAKFSLNQKTNSAVEWATNSPLATNVTRASA